MISTYQYDYSKGKFDYFEVLFKQQVLPRVFQVEFRVDEFTCENVTSSEYKETKYKFTYHLN